MPNGAIFIKQMISLHTSDDLADVELSNKGYKYSNDGEIKSGYYQYRFIMLT